MTQPPNDRLPPNQVLAAKGKWPLVGERQPRVDDSTWHIQVKGQVESPRNWSLSEFKDSFQIQDHVVDIHCVTRWSMLDATFSGIRLLDVLEFVRPKADANYVSFVARSERNHSTSLSLQDVHDLDPLIAFKHNEQPLASEHGGPVRMIVPGRYFYKSIKWLETIHLLSEDQLGYWEGESGYHNHADPWKEERYIASGLKRSEVQRLLRSKDLSSQTLLSLEAPHIQLPDLIAPQALLRNANFKQAHLPRANFQEANLSNAHFQNADLTDANFRNADVEGANFCGAILSGCDFRGASLFGATFCPEPGDAPEIKPAVLSETTQIPEESWEALSDSQRVFLGSSLENKRVK